MASFQGLAYTMLSRATNRSGIKSDIVVNKKAVEEITRMLSESLLEIPLYLHGNGLYIGHTNIRSLRKHACDQIHDPTIK
ncbi:hypothetical protein MAR_032159 [Mya arenaria]|uniref:Uncharacterized protein n=1 Tax=Mya arenaria TaxID=6604 RepID=A0ABY7F5Y6_MYAAR|nr:hypothetical protein MAR_032159 [Mya arenaria]